MKSYGSILGLSLVVFLCYSLAHPGKKDKRKLSFGLEDIVNLGTVEDLLRLVCTKLRNFGYRLPVYCNETEHQSMEPYRETVRIGPEILRLYCVQLLEQGHPLPDFCLVALVNQGRNTSVTLSL